MAYSTHEIEALVQPTRFHRVLYTDPEIFDLEMERIWGSSWIYIGHESQVPRDRAAPEALPGVGPTTANVVLNVAFGEPVIAVDTHIFRLGNRTGLAPGKTPLDVERKLNEITPAKWKLHAHHWLILHGRYVCKARTPECWRCRVADLCSYRKKTPEPARKAPVRKE